MDDFPAIVNKDEKVTELINRLDSNIIQCNECKKYFKKEDIFNFTVFKKSNPEEMNDLYLCLMCVSKIKTENKYQIFPIPVSTERFF